MICTEKARANPVCPEWCDNTSRWQSDYPQSVWVFSVDCHRLNNLLLLVDRLCVFVQTVTCRSILSCSNLNGWYKSLTVLNLFECFLLTVRVFHCFCTGFVCLYRQRHVIPCQGAATWTVHWALRLPVCILTNHKPVHSCARCCVSEDLLAGCLLACLLASWIWLCIDDNSSRYLFRNRRHCRCALTSFSAAPCVRFLIYLYFLFRFLLCFFPLTPLCCFSVVQVEVYLISENSVNDLAG